jgi:uridine kinase
MSNEELNVSFYIGRFQPLHIGHLHIIQQELEDKDILIVLVGNDSGSKNPYTISQRFDFIKGSLLEINPALIHKLKLDTIDEKYLYEPSWDYWYMRLIDKIKLEIDYLRLFNPDKKINVYLSGSQKDESTTEYINTIFEYCNKSGINIKSSIVKPIMNLLNQEKTINATTVRRFTNNLKNIIRTNRNIMSFNFNKINSILPNYVSYKILNTLIDRKKKFIIGIAGMSGSGKTIFSNKLLETLINTHFLNRDDILLISIDNYFKNIDNQEYLNDPNYNTEGKNTVNLMKLSNNLIKIKNNEEVNLPIYNFKKCMRSNNSNKIYSLDKKVIIIEGLFTLSETIISDLLDLKIFIDIDYNEAYRRRFTRNKINRGFNNSQIELTNAKIRKSWPEYENRSKAIADNIFKTNDLIKNNTIINNISNIIIKNLLYKE